MSFQKNSTHQGLIGFLGRFLLCEYLNFSVPMLNNEYKIVKQTPANVINNKLYM